MRKFIAWSGIFLITGLFVGAGLFPISKLGADEAPNPELFPAELTVFTPYEHNPVFTAAGEDAWDSGIRERGWILREGDVWHLWYTGFDKTGKGLKMLGYATSSDGLKWKRHGSKPLFDESWVEDMMVVKVGDTYHMFAEGLNDHAQRLTSTDGLNWDRVGTLDIRYTNGKPLTPGPFGTPTAWYEDGTWYLFYERRDEAIWLASSRDMKVWTNVQDEPVILCGPGGYDKLMVAVNQIIKHDGRYYASFHGTGSTEKPRDWTSNLAVSTDLIHWTKFPGNPLLPEKDNKSSGLLIHDGEQFRFYTMHAQVDVYLPKQK